MRAFVIAALLSAAIAVSCTGADPSNETASPIFAMKYPLTITLHPAESGRAGELSVQPAPFYTLDKSCETSCQLYYLKGNKVTLTMKAHEGVAFVGWSGDCSGIGTCELTMESPKNVSARFKDL